MIESTRVPFRCSLPDVTPEIKKIAKEQISCVLGKSLIERGHIKFSETVVPAENGEFLEITGIMYTLEEKDMKKAYLLVRELKRNIPESQQENLKTLYNILFGDLKIPY